MLPSSEALWRVDFSLLYVPYHQDWRWDRWPFSVLPFPDHSPLPFLKTLRFDYQAIWLYFPPLTFVGVISQHLYHCLEFLKDFGSLVTVTQLTMLSWFLVILVFIQVILTLVSQFLEFFSSVTFPLPPAPNYTNNYFEDLVNISFCTLFIITISCISITVYYLLSFQLTSLVTQHQ